MYLYIWRGMARHVVFATAAGTNGKTPWPNKIRRRAGCLLPRIAPRLDSFSHRWSSHSQVLGGVDELLHLSRVRLHQLQEVAVGHTEAVHLPLGHRRHLRSVFRGGGENHDHAHATETPRIACKTLSRHKALESISSESSHLVPRGNLIAYALQASAIGTRRSQSSTPHRDIAEIFGARRVFFCHRVRVFRACAVSQISTPTPLPAPKRPRAAC